MPRPFRAPVGGVWGMGIRLCISRIFKRCRSLSAAIVVVSVWLFLITVINFGSKSQQGNIGLKDDSHLLIRSRGLASYLALVAFSPTEKRLESPSSGKLEAKLGQRDELKASITDFQSPMKAERIGQTSSVVKNGIIRGRRIQEIMFTQIRALETLSRGYDADLGDRYTRNGKGSGVFISGEQAQIDTKSIAMIEPRPDTQTPTKNLGDLQLNWTLKPETDVFHISVHGIPGYERSHTREESKPNSTTSSPAKNAESKSDSSDHKTRSQDPELPVLMVKYRLHGQEKSISGHFQQSIGEMNNLQSNLYDGSSGAINKDFNVNERNGAAEKDASLGSGMLSIGNGYHSHRSSQTKSHDVTNTQSLKGTPHKSNLQSPADVQMNVSKRDIEFSSHNAIDHSIHSLPQQIRPDVKYPEHLAPLTALNESNILLNRSNVISTSTKIDMQERGESNVVVIKNRHMLTSIEAGGKIVAVETQQILSDDYKDDSLTNNSEKHYVDVRPLENGTESSFHVKPGLHVDLKYDGFELYSYNVTASNALPVNREIPDTRPEGCDQIPAYTYDGLSKTTVIICFHNEAFSVLQRTLRSVLDRTPSRLLEKIILVDDYSTQDGLAASLEEEMRSMAKVLLTRTSKREGLVGARLLGSRLATSEVIVFLDAHCECNVGWLEPLLFSLSLNPKKVVSPYIDTIKSENFQYKQSPAQLQGGFTWRLEFGWRAAAGGRGLLKETQPILTPVISGGLFAVRRDYFILMGSYDPQFNIWGGENFELSFKTWMCGGSVEIVPCSRVGHVFRASLPYTFTGDREKTVLRNLARVASVWMDEYADIFYAAANLPNDLDIGDTSERAQLRKDLNCHSFKWYLDNVFPQMDIVAADTVVYGQVRNKGSLMCFDVLSSRSGYYLGLSPCHGGRNQTFHLTSDSQLKQGDACILPGINKQLMLSRCTSNLTWIYKRDILKLKYTNLCVTSVDNAFIHLLPCNDVHTATMIISSNSKPDSKIYHTGSTSPSSHSFQEWTFDYSFNWKRRRRKSA